jgi:hypothetical protein
VDCQKLDWKHHRRICVDAKNPPTPVTPDIMSKIAEDGLVHDPALTELLQRIKDNLKWVGKATSSTWVDHHKQSVFMDVAINVLREATKAIVAVPDRTSPETYLLLERATKMPFCFGNTWDPRSDNSFTIPIQPPFSSKSGLRFI